MLTSCGSDPAEQEYLKALAGDEDGSTHEERLAHIRARRIAERWVQLERERDRGGRGR